MKSQIVGQKCGCEGCDEVAQLEADIQGCLRYCIRDFRLIVRDGGLVLFGHTRSYYGKQLVQHRVMERCRLPIQSNNIEVL